MVSWKRFEGRDHALILRYFTGFHVERLRKTVKNSQDSRSPGRDLKLELSEYEAGVLTTFTVLSVM
jgi:hypothetical protein